ncbi:Glucose--fructose oxidoreductase precursor [Aquisphaera giovannonii]|uniref:Glucose--fructose oxidoreductase n=1 Tax=Aquisphaera giovannonii TaxID=406548 RepID=A0A5B9VZM1_9BACT|nr:Gfo/Idh/MocA family oxidoreductase [Aquisphaera giovannonii]QEH33225.1 Glucose--fructose oxidoreductase precursor [Aquisphaera giovannonii]
MREIKVAMIGEGFMGRTHSNAWSQVSKFFKPPARPVMHTSCGRRAEDSKAFASHWGWGRTSTNWADVVKLPEIDLVDVVTPNNTHAEIAMAAIAAGKHVACEKPIAGTLAEARQMVEAARKAQVKTFVWYNYRRCPAIAFAHKLVKDGAVGTIRHVRGFYLQDWADESIPLIWRFQKEGSGSGSHGDLNAHIIDMTRFVTGEEITEVTGAIAETFIKQRKRMTGATAGGIAAGVQGGGETGPVTVDDTVLFLARFSGGAVASFEAARQATGNQNRNGFEINGSKGALKFDFERMNELQFYDATRPRAVQGWTTIMCTHGGDHPYAGNWWPDAHVLGYEHGFVNQAYDILLALAGEEPTVPIPDFEDAYKTQRVLEAALVAAAERRPVPLSEIE